MSSGKFYIQDGYIYGPEMSGKFLSMTATYMAQRIVVSITYKTIISMGRKKATSFIFKTTIFMVQTNSFLGLKTSF